MRRTISLFLALLMLFGILAPGALAAEQDTSSNISISLYSSLPFNDVNSNNWFYHYVRTMHLEGIMQGTTPSTFAPHDTFSRAQVLATLFRIHHGRAANATDLRNNNFSDVASTVWSAPYVTWAANNGITPTSSGTFGPNQAATRQEIALLIHRYVINMTTRSSGSVADAQWNRFTDRNQIAGQDAYLALRFANNNGIVTGIERDGVFTIAPTATATRAQAATMLVRLLGLLPGFPPDPGPAPHAFEQRVFELVNIERTNRGLHALAWHNTLATLARAHSVDMVNRDFFYHTCPSGRSPSDRMIAAGIRGSIAAENIAFGFRTPEEVVNAWMGSQSHRDNILHPSLRHLGVGFYRDHWTQKFFG